MNILLDGVFQGGFLDETLSCGSVRIQVRGCLTLSTIQNQYIERPKNLSYVWQYIKKIGIRAVILKIISRMSESDRNQKYFSIGYGVIEQHSIPDQARENLIGKHCFFIMPNHPRCMERVVLPRDLFTVSDSLIWMKDLPKNQIFYRDISSETVPESLRCFIGWTPHMGKLLPTRADEIHELLEDYWHKYCISHQFKSFLREISREPIKEMSESIPRINTSDKPVGVLYGYGNYAKTVILRNVDSSISIQKIHEIDVLQIGNRLKKFVWDTSPNPRVGEKFDAYFIAGYHHTHINLAIHALSSGAYAVIEKPLATTRQDFERLIKMMDSVPDRVFVGFQKRYAFFNDWVQEDMGFEFGQAPISYHCIVYEEKLPKNHWYEWPNSRSRIVSNGCHWIDHFLYVNDYAEISDASVRQLDGGTFLVIIQLKNSAGFSMILTETGSGRIGVQDYIELRANQTTVKIQNSQSYSSENQFKVLRKKFLSPEESYRTMYKTIAQRIAQKLPGDSMKSICRTTDIMLRLDEQLISYSNTDHHDTIANYKSSEHRDGI